MDEFNRWYDEQNADKQEVFGGHARVREGCFRCDAGEFRPAEEGDAPTLSTLQQVVYEGS